MAQHARADRAGTVGTERASYSPPARKCACGKGAGFDDQCGGCRGFARKARDAGTPAMPERLGEGAPLAGQARSRMESAFGRQFSDVTIHADAEGAAAASDLRARAFTIGNHVGFAAGEYQPGTMVGDALLAHELAHVIQQEQAPADRQPLRKAEDSSGPMERDADETAMAAVANLWGEKLGVEKRPVRPGARGGELGLQRCGQKKPEAELKPMTHDEMVVARARKLLPILENYVTEWNVREARRMRERGTRDKMLASRKTIEDPLAALQGRPEMEADRIKKLNRRPLSVEVSEDKVVFRVKFQAQFEDRAQKANFGKLKAAVEEAARTTWNQDADPVMEGKRFEVIPEVTLIGKNEKHDQNYWLIFVREKDESKVEYPGCQLDDPGATVAAVTDPTCDGGVMNLPPRGITNPDLIGHEMLHLFGLVDRYLMLEHVKDDGTRETSTVPTRTPGRGRLDPLGAEKGRILPEDVAFLFDNLGVYDIEAYRGLATLERLEKQGLGIGDVTIMIERQKEIIRVGRDPRSLIRPRTDFNDKMFKNAEDL